MIRDNLQYSRPRCHYNHRGKTKLTFETEEDALLFIKKLKLEDYVIYQCKVCSKYHIGKQKKAECK